MKKIFIVNHLTFSIWGNMGKAMCLHKGLTAANELDFTRTQLDKGVDDLDLSVLLAQEGEHCWWCNILFCFYTT